LNPSLEPLFKKLSGEIRKVDGHHILFLGGAQWDTNFSVFGKPFDANVAYTFHKYWTAPDESVIRQYIDFRERYDVPIWMGESGRIPTSGLSNSRKRWRKTISDGFWPYKKMEKPSAVSALFRCDWEKIVELQSCRRHWARGGTLKSGLIRRRSPVLRRVAGECPLQKCRVNEGYLKALGLKADVAPAAWEEQRSERADRGGWIDLFGAEEGVAEEEEDAEDPDEGADFAVAAVPSLTKVKERRRAEAMAMLKVRGVATRLEGGEGFVKSSQRHGRRRGTSARRQG